MAKSLSSLAVLLALACGLSAQPTATKGPFQLYQVIEQRDVYPKEEAGIVKLPFPKVPWGGKNYEILYTCVLCVQVPDAQVGDVLDLRAAVTVMQRPFKDFRTKKPGSAFCPSELTVHTEAPPQDGKIHGVRIWPASGENVNDKRSYYQVSKSGWHTVKATPVYVCYWLYPASMGGKDTQYLSIPTTSSYNVLYVGHFQRVTEPQPEEPGDPGP